MSTTGRATTAGMALVALAILVAEPALAAPEGQTTTTSDTAKIGENLGQTLISWGKALLLGVVGFVGLPALARRDFAQTMVIIGIAVLIGGFVFATSTVEGIVEGFWKTLDRG